MGVILGDLLSPNVLLKRILSSRKPCSQLSYCLSCTYVFTCVTIRLPGMKILLLKETIASERMTHISLNDRTVHFNCFKWMNWRSRHAGDLRRSLNFG